jgi:hypothetical protein
MIPVYVPANDAFTSVSSLLPTLDSLEGVLSQLADLLVGRGIGGEGSNGGWPRSQVAL